MRKIDMSVTDKVLTDISAAIATITFNNPKRLNAMSLEMWQATADALEKLGADPEVRVVVLTGAGNRAFVSGADISEFDSERGKGDAVTAYNAAIHRVQQTLVNFDGPTIAMVRGYCLGGGLSIAAACDLRVANEAARFGVPAAKLGVGLETPRAFSPELLPERIAYQRTSRAGAAFPSAA